MYKFIHISTLIYAEIIIRLTMITILMTAGISKLYSNGQFLNYYSRLFQGELRINLPATLVDTYLAAIPYIEIGLGIALVTHHLKPYTIFFGVVFFLVYLSDTIFWRNGQV